MFEKFTGSGNPIFYLKIYYEKLIGVGNNEGIRIKLFNQSLTGKALEWYSKQHVTKWRTWDDLANAFVDHYKCHVEIFPDRISITKLKPKSTECLRICHSLERRSCHGAPTYGGIRNDHLLHSSSRIRIL